MAKKTVFIEGPMKPEKLATKKDAPKKSSGGKKK